MIDLTIARDNMSKIMNEHLSGQDFSQENCQHWLQLISDKIMEMAKGLNYHRYKLIVHLTIADIRGTLAMSNSRCLWDEETDAYTTYTFQNDSVLCTGSIYAVYLY